MQWTMVAIAVILTVTAAAVAITLILARREEDETNPINGWRVELWNIRQGCRIDLRFEHSAVVGRRTVCGVSADGQPMEQDNTISREHMLLYEQAGMLWVWNLSAVNPVVLNGQRLNAPSPLRTGSRLELGNSVFLVTRADKICSR